MAKWILIVAAVPFGALAIVAAIGALLPRDHVARGERLVGAPPERIAAMIRNVEAYPRWRSRLDAVGEVRREARQVRFVERSAGDAIAYTLVEETPGRRFKSTISDATLPFGGSWTILVEPAGADTRVEIEERGHVGNPIYRFVSTLILGHDRSLKTYLDDLERAGSVSSEVSGARDEPSA